jgi:pimeloyl-ACP methyl ester carboxylesterase
MPIQQVGDIRMHYAMHGAGFPLIMIIGMSANIDWWDPRLILAFAPSYRTIVFDNRGTGRSGISDKEFSIRLFADDTAALLDALGISRAHVFGLSMGGMIAQELALKHPEKVDKLILCSTTCGGQKGVPPSLDVLNLLMAERDRISPEQRARQIVSLLVTPEFMENNPVIVELMIQQILKQPISSAAYTQQVTSLLTFDTSERLHQITAPSLILHGRRDTLLPYANGPILAQAIGNARLISFEHAAHAIMEEMDALIPACLEFLAEA